MPKGNLTRLARNFAGRTPELCFAVASGAGANSDITVTGVKLGRDQLVSVIEVPASTTTLVDRTAASSITADDTIQCTSSTSGNQVLVVYYHLV